MPSSGQRSQERALQACSRQAGPLSRCAQKDGDSQPVMCLLIEAVADAGLDAYAMQNSPMLPACCLFERLQSNVHATMHPLKADLVGNRQE